MRRVWAQALADFAAAGDITSAITNAAAGLGRVTGEPAEVSSTSTPRYHRRVFLAPPWPEIYTGDRERRHDLASAIGEYEHLRRVYPALGYEVIPLPKAPVTERAELIPRRLATNL